MTMIIFSRSGVLTNEQNGETIPKHCQKYILWEEYAKSLSSSNAAKDFTSKERDAVQQKYSRWEVFWNFATQQNSGLSADVAIDHISKR